MKKKRIVLFAAVFSLLLVFTGCGGEEKREASEAKAAEEKWAQLTQAEQYDAVAKVYADARGLKRLAGEGTPYPQVYLSMESGKLTGRTKDASFQSVKEIITISQAVEWYAAKEGIEVSEKEIDRYMEKLFAEMKEADGFEEMNAAFRKCGFTFEEYHFLFPEFYRWQYLATEVLAEDGKEADTDQIAAEYKDTADYDELLQLLISCRELYESGVGVSDKILSEEIYYN